MTFLNTSAGDLDDAKLIREVVEDGRLGVWQLDSILAEGGMGTVYRAHRADGLYDHDVAIKIVYFDSARFTEAFARERERLARLEHPGIVRIIDGGSTPAGAPYMVMELVDGQPIDVYAQSKALDLRGKVKLFVALCDAIAHAHENQLLHRDIKPDNILVTRDGRIRCIDFGIASDIEGAALQGSATFAYAAPEQIANDGQSTPQSTRSDIFSIGMTIAKVLSGQLPKRREDCSVELAPGSIADPELACLVETCLQRDPALRYDTVQALRRDLLAWLDHRALSACEARMGRLYALRKFARRQRVPLTLGALLLVGLCVAFAVNWLQLQEVRQSRALAQSELERANAYIEQSEFMGGQSMAFVQLQRQLVNQLGDADEVDAYLMDHWRGLHANAAADPHTASLISHALGHHLLAGGRYDEAREVLGAWLEAGYGNAVARREGLRLYGIVLNLSGDSEAAIPSMRELVTYYEVGPLRGSREHLEAAGALARFSRRDEDFSAALALADEQLADDGLSSSDRVFALSFHTQLQIARGDEAGAREGFEELFVLLQQPGSNYDDALRENAARLATARFFYDQLNDPDRAAVMAKQIQSVSEQLNLRSQELFEAQLMLAEIALDRDDRETALSWLGPLQEQDAAGQIPAGNFSARLWLLAAEAALLSGETESVAEILADVGTWPAETGLHRALLERALNGTQSALSEAEQTHLAQSPLLQRLRARLARYR